MGLRDIKVLQVVLLMATSVYAHDGHAEHWTHTRYGLAIPPTDTTLLIQENNKQDADQLNTINTIVERAVQKDARTPKIARKKKAQHHACSNTDTASSKQGQLDAAVEREARYLLDAYYEDRTLTSKHVTIKLHDVNIRKALELIGKLTETIFIMDAEVDGLVQNFSFHEAPLSTVLSVLLQNNLPRLAAIKEAGIWRILKRSTALELLSLKAEGIIEHDTVATHVTMQHITWNQEFKKRIEHLWQGIIGKDALKHYYLAFDDESRNIFFRGRQRIVADFKKALEEIDKYVPQVRIDARVVIASKDFEECVGFDWSGVYDRSASISQNGYSFAGVGIGEKSATTDTPNIGDLLGWTLNFLPAAIREKRTIKIPFIFGNKNLDMRRLNIMLNAAEDNKQLETILKPSLLVKSRESAEILVGQEMPHETRLQETVEGSPTNVTTVSYKDIGMKISVKPVVSPDNRSVFLDIFVQNSFIDKTRIPMETSTENSRLGSFPYTVVTSRSSNRVLLADGQTTMISGLIENSKERQETGVPWIKDIPVLGWFFKGKRKQVVDKQLLVFITPTLV